MNCISQTEKDWHKMYLTQREKYLHLEISNTMRMKIVKFDVYSTLLKYMAQKVQQ